MVIKIKYNYTVLVVILNLVFPFSAQKNAITSFAYNPNVPHFPLGLNIFSTPKNRFTVFGDFKYYKTSEGRERSDAEPGVGIYAPGEWGNTGSSNPENYQYYGSYSYVQSTLWHLGVGWTAYHKGYLSFTPYFGLGEYTYESFKEYYTFVSDKQTYNVIGMQEISLLDHFDLKSTSSVTFGLLCRWKALAFGLGYDTAPKGISITIGFNITDNLRNY
jgi:hypothetical protein